MKPRSLIVLGAAAVFTVNHPSAFGQGAPVPCPPARIRLDVQMVSLPVAEAARLIPAFQNRQTANEAWNRLQAMITSDEATLIGWPMLWIRNGERSTFENVVEERSGAEPLPIQPPVMAFSTRWYTPTWGPYIPTAFAATNAGVRLEAGASIARGGQSIAVNLEAEYLHRIATREWQTQADPNGITGIQQQPEYSSSKIRTSLDVHPETSVLISTFVVAEPQPHVELFILHARATLLPPSALPSTPAK